MTWRSARGPAVQACNNPGLDGPETPFRGWGCLSRAATIYSSVAEPTWELNPCPDGTQVKDLDKGGISASYCFGATNTHQTRRVPDFWSVTGSPLKKLTCQATMSSFG